MRNTTTEAAVELVDGMAFQATTSSGQVLMLDAEIDHGGSNRGAHPLELLLIGLGGCAGMDVISILRKMRQDVSSYRVVVRGDQRDAHPRIYARISIEHTVHGRGLDVEAVRRAVELSTSRYCAAAAMLGAAAELEEVYIVVDDLTGNRVAGTHRHVAA